MRGQRRVRNVRSSLAADAANGYALVSAGSGVALQRRRNNSGDGLNHDRHRITAPYWVRLVRQGDTVTAYSSANGNTWSMLTAGLSRSRSTVYVGIATASHNASAITSAAVSYRCRSISNRRSSRYRHRKRLLTRRCAIDRGLSFI